MMQAIVSVLVLLQFQSLKHLLNAAQAEVCHRQRADNSFNLSLQTSEVSYSGTKTGSRAQFPFD